MQDPSFPVSLLDSLITMANQKYVPSHQAYFGPT